MRSKSDCLEQVTLPPFIKTTAQGVHLSVKLQPRASKTGIAGVLGNELRISVTAPPVDAAANQALVEFLAETMDCSRGQIQIVRGQTSRHKTILITGLSAESAAQALS
ncbi:MAG: YggU family protein [Verrucomicrobia bacterium]|nr:YggU family protein [Verrucomicrobiota bacterium]